MKIFNLLSIAAKNLKGKWAVLPVIGITVSTFCLCYAGAILITVQEEKALPYEIVVSAEGAQSLSDNVVAEISQIAEVTAATAVLQVPVSITADEYTAEMMMMTGIDAAYIETSLSEGSFFLNDTIMPYIVLNEAACKQFANDGEDTDNEAPDIDWLNASIYVQMGEETKAITSKVCGILSNDEETEEVQEPVAYISLSVAKELLQQTGQSADYMAIHVRIANIGCAQSVSKEISALGFPVTNSNEELQAEWDTDTKEMTYLIVVGAFCLLCAAVLMAAWRKISMLEQRRVWETMKWIGLKASDMRKLFMFETILLSIFGIALGIVIAIVLPSFLSVEATEETNFMLTIPFEAAFASVIICVVAGMMPILGMRKQT